MIKGFKDKKTQKFAQGGFIKQSEPFRQQAEKRIRILEAAHTLGDLAQLPSNKFETLQGGRKGQYSIRINIQWRICFEWKQGEDGPDQVEIVDYH